MKHNTQHIHGTIHKGVINAPEIKDDLDYVLCLECIESTIQCLKELSSKKIPQKRAYEIENINESFNTAKRLKVYTERIEEYLIPKTK